MFIFLAKKKKWLFLPFMNKYRRNITHLKFMGIHPEYLQRYSEKLSQKAKFF